MALNGSQIIGRALKIDSAKTIQKRSDGSFEFVNEYRKFTKVPPPKIEKVKIRKFIENIVKLMQVVVAENKIQLNYKISAEDLEIAMDTNLIEQVMINLLKNAIEALKGTKKPEINITAEKSLIQVSDNAPTVHTAST